MEQNTKNQLTQAKIAFLLSTCNKLSSKLFVQIFKTFENSQTMSMKYYYELYINLDLIKENNKFILKSITESFLDFISSSNRLNKIILNFDNKFSNLNEYNKESLYNNYTNAFLKPNLNNFHILTPLNMINKFLKCGYKYIFIPLILDYNQDKGLVHQCAIIINIQPGLGEFIFYEPYGLYNKYNADYSEPINIFFQIYYEFLPSNIFHNKTGKIRFTTYHKKFYEGNYGIQNIMLLKNNSRDFETKFYNLLNKMDKNFLKLKEKILNLYKNDKNPVNKTDNTIIILNTLTEFNKYNPKIENANEYIEIWNEMYLLYHSYNSKTCVTITIVELFNFFNNFSSPEIIHEYIDKYKKTDIPNIILLEDIHKIIKTTECKNYIDIINETNNTKKICQKI